jgi:acyl homoserine lactone synthase
MDIQIGRVSEGTFRSTDIDAMHALRFEVFRERLGWEVPCVDRREIDDYDSLDPTYMLVKDSHGAVTGCWRMLPTTTPYMMKDTFPQTLGGQVAPEDETIWELSRFALGRHEGSTSRFCDTVLLMMARAVEHAMSQGVTAFVSVTTTAIERLMKSLGLKTQRFAPPVQIGIEKTVAFRLEVNQEVLDHLRSRFAVSAAAAAQVVAAVDQAAAAAALDTGSIRGLEFA